MIVIIIISITIINSSVIIFICILIIIVVDCFLLLFNLIEKCRRHGREPLNDLVCSFALVVDKMSVALQASRVYLRLYLGTLVSGRIKRSSLQQILPQRLNHNHSQNQN